MMYFRDLIDQSSLMEASFSEKRIRKVVKIYSSIMGKSFGGKFKMIGLEEYNRKSGLERVLE